MILTKRNYYSRKANREYMSVSQFKAFTKCPAAALAELRGDYKREKTTALLVGSYIDSYFEGTLKSFKRQNPEIFKKDGTLKAEYIQAEQIIQRIERDDVFMQHIMGEHQVIMEGKICGVPVKIKIDSLLEDVITDLKIVRDFEDIRDEECGWLPWYEYWRYDLQGAVYQEIVRQNIGMKLPFVLAAATKEKITDIDLLEIDQSDLDMQLDNVKRYIETYDAIKKGIVLPERCEACDYCKSTKILKEPRNTAELF